MSSTDFLRQAFRRRNSGLPPTDAAPSLPAVPQQYVQGSASSPGSTVDERRQPWGVLKARGTGFPDGRKLIPGAGVTLFGRILRWLELQGFIESCAIATQLGDGRVLIDPRLSNNTIVTLTRDALFVFPNGYNTDVQSLLPPSELEMQRLGTPYRRARVQPHTVFVTHNGYRIGTLDQNGEIQEGSAFNGAVIPTDSTIPSVNQGVTGFTAVHVNDPRRSSAIPWRITGFSSWPQ